MVPAFKILICAAKYTGFSTGSKKINFIRQYDRFDFVILVCLICNTDIILVIAFLRVMKSSDVNVVFSRRYVNKTGPTGPTLTGCG